MSIMLNVCKTFDLGTTVWVIFAHMIMVITGLGKVQTGKYVHHVCLYVPTCVQASLCVSYIM